MTPAWLFVRDREHLMLPERVAWPGHAAFWVTRGDGFVWSSLFGSPLRAETRLKIDVNERRDYVSRWPGRYCACPAAYLRERPVAGGTCDSCLAWLAWNARP